MRNRKRVLKQFHYWECDTFAKYLHDMSAKGWHFTGWKLGLIFERGTPEDIYYAVEVFPKGSEMDTRPEPDAEEYADYCEAAGWKFLDSSRRFCVFKKERKDAVPIVTQEERLKNIKRAGWRKWMSESAAFFILAVNLWISFLTFNFKQYIFWDLMLFLIFSVTLACGEKLLECVLMLTDAYRKKKILAAGEIPFYGSGLYTVSDYFRCYMGIAVVAVLLILACIQKYYDIATAIMITALVLIGISAAIAIFRPTREGNWMFQVGAGLGIGAIVLPILLAVILTDDGDKVKLTEREIPLTQADFRSVAGEIDFTDEGHFQGIFGEMSFYSIQYAEPVGPWGGGTDSMQYYIYRTKHSWILNRIYRQYLERMKQPEECTKDWKAKAAVYDSLTGNYYLVLFQEQLLYLYSDKPLEETQLQIICDKLEVGDSA